MVWSDVHHPAGPPMIGRLAEREAIGRLLESVRDGFSAVLVLNGDAGVGKSRLLQYAAESAQDLTVVRLVGVEAETRLGYGALHRLLRPYLSRLPTLPQRQRDALSAAFGLTDAPPSDRHLVGLAALTLLSQTATAAPMLCLVDDVQWLDRESAETLAFVGRRLYADCLGLLFAGRERTGDLDVFGDLPTLRLDGLKAVEATALLTSGVTGHLAPTVAEQLVTGTGGNPLALLELAVTLDSGQLRGVAPLPEPLPVNRQLENHFRQKAALLPADTRTLLLLTAMTPTDDQAARWRAAGALGLSVRSAMPAVAAGILNRGTTAEFRHPLIRSAVHSAASADERRRVQAALAATSAPERRAWHLAEATDGPDDHVAAELEAASELAQARGGYSEQALVLTRAAEMTTQPGRRAERYLHAAAAHLTAGDLPKVQALIELATPDLTGPAARVRATRLRASVEMFCNRPREVPAILLSAVAELGTTDPVASWELLREAVKAAIVGGRTLAGTTLQEVAEAAADAWREVSPSGGPDSLIAALAQAIAHGYTTGAPALAAALARLRTADEVHEQNMFSLISCVACDELWDIEAKREILGKLVTADRDRGALSGLSLTLLSLAEVEILNGRFAAAESCYDESDHYMAATGYLRSGDFHKALLYAWTGREAELRTAVAALRVMSEEQGPGIVDRWASHALSVFEIGRGRYREALDAQLATFPGHPAMLGDIDLAGMVEAGVRSGDRSAATMAMERLEERAPLAGTPWALGLLARCRALMTDNDDEAESLYVESVSQLAKVPLAVELAWSRLLFGEWLRRRKRRADARVQLRAAFESFDAWGAVPFAERARMELLATGETARRRTASTQLDLTPQEHHVALLAASGLTNTEIAGRLFVTTSTIEFHLSRVFRKLGITSRKQIGARLPESDSGD